MLKYSLLIFVLLVGCTATRVIEKKERVETRDVVVKPIQPAPAFDEKIDFHDLIKPDSMKTNKPVPGKPQPKIIDSTPVNIVVPKKVEFPPQNKTVYIDSLTTVDLMISAKLDSGILDYNVDVISVKYQEKTKIQTETEYRDYTKWIIGIAILAFVAIIIIVIKVRGK